jgi:hypothetical protein
VSEVAGVFARWTDRECPHCGDPLPFIGNLFYPCPTCGRVWVDANVRDGGGGALVDWTRTGMELFAGWTDDGRAKALLLAGGREALRLSATIAARMAGHAEAPGGRRGD